MTGRRLDIARTLGRAIKGVWDDLPPVLLGGAALVLWPALVARWLSAAGDWGTIGVTVRAVLAMLFVVIVGHGVLARLAGRPLSAAMFLIEGARRSRPGLEVALLLGAGAVLLLTLQLFARPGSGAGVALDLLLLCAALWAASRWLPALTLAVAERRNVFLALARSAELTEGSRWRLLALVAAPALLLVPMGIALAGMAASETLTLASPGLWLELLFELAVWALLGALSASSYAGLAEPG